MGSLARLFFVALWGRFVSIGLPLVLAYYYAVTMKTRDSAFPLESVGAFMVLSYLAPALCGILVDNFADTRRGIILGLSVAIAGTMCFLVARDFALSAGLGLVCVGLGLLRPAIATSVAALYPREDRRQGVGFLFFYMATNLGAFLATVLCIYTGDLFGWQYGFLALSSGLIAALLTYLGSPVVRGMAVILATLFITVFSVHSQVKAVDVHWIGRFSPLLGMICLQGIVVVNWKNIVGRSASPITTGNVIDSGAAAILESATQPSMRPCRNFLFFGSLLLLAICLTLAISGFSSYTKDGSSVQFDSYEVAASELQDQAGLWAGLKIQFYLKMATISGRLILLTLFVIFVYLARLAYVGGGETRRSIATILVLCLFSVSFLALLEAGTTVVTNLIYFHVDRVDEESVVSVDEVGYLKTITVTQEQIGHQKIGKMSYLGIQPNAVFSGRRPFPELWTMTEDDVGMGVASWKDEVPTASFELLTTLGLFILGGFLMLVRQFMSPRPKPASGRLQNFAIGFGMMALSWVSLLYGVGHANDRDMFPIIWLVLGVLLQVTAQLFVIPFALAEISRIAPQGYCTTFLGFYYFAMFFSFPLSELFRDLGMRGIPSPWDYKAREAFQAQDYSPAIQSLMWSALILAVICFAFSKFRACSKESTQPVRQYGSVD